MSAPRAHTGSISCSLIHTLAAAFELSLIVLKSALAFEIIKYLGAIYLVYLGVSSFSNKKRKVPHLIRAKLQSILHVNKD
ncbi:LysE family transporter [Bacillus pumilus]|uniref:LysE family transporter n=1 Tax=Bacillus pumilus TaxID=1408 RepID=UPI00333DD3F1